MTFDAARAQTAIRAAAEVVIAHHAELTRLDQEIGDGDHGENLARGFTAVVAKLDRCVPDTPGQVFELTAQTLISNVGGASGPLLGTAFLRAAAAMGPAPELTAELAAAALAAARDGVVLRGKAEPGDKTMVDALSPAADAARTAAEAGLDVVAVLRAAADAAEQGAQATGPMRARKGRAAYLGDRSIGHVDPGARSTAYLLTALADTAAARAESV